MSFLHFRTARRKAKKIVSIRPVHHVPSLPSPGSFTSNDVVEISDAYRSSEPHFGLASPQVDIEFSNEPLFSSDPFVSSTGTYLERAPASDVDEWQNVPPHMPAASSSGESSRSLQDDVGLESEVHSLPEFGFSDLAVKYHPTRRAPKPAPAPIKIPGTSSHVLKVQIQRSSGKSAELPPVLAGETHTSPVLDDNASIVSGITLPGALIGTSDQPRDNRLSRRITRLDSATLPRGEHPLMDSPPWSHAEFGQGDESGASSERGSAVPPVPRIPSATSSSASGVRLAGGRARGNFKEDSSPVASSSRQETTPLKRKFGTGRLLDLASPSQRFSAITEVSTPGVLSPVTPDRSKGPPNATSGMSPQAQSTGLSESGQFTQSGPASDRSLPSGEGITLLLDDFSASLSSLKTASERSQSSPAPSLADGSGPSGSRAQPGSQRRPSAGAPLDRRSPNRSRPGSRSISRPSLASVNSLLLHPSLLHPIGERRASSIRYPGGSANVSPTTSSPEDITLSGLPSSLGTSRSQHVSQLPSFPESARMLSPDFPSSARLSESPTTPDPLDNMVLADDTGGALPYKRNVLTVMRKSSGAIDLDVPESGEVFSPAQSTPSTASGNKQTFPETPNAMSPTFSPGVTSVHGTALPSANPLGLRSGSIHRSMRGRANRKSERLLIGRSVSSRTLSSGVRPRKRSIKSKLSRTSVASSAYALSEEGSSVPPTEGEAPARQLDVEKSSPTVSATSHRRTGSVKVSSSIPPVPLAVPPPPPLASPRISSDEQPGNATPAPQQLPPPPPPPQLLPAPHSHSHSHPPTQALVPPPPPPPHVLSSPPAHPRSSPTPPPSFESSSTDSHQNRAPPPPYQYLTPSPTVPPPHFLPNIPPPPPLPSQANVFGQANARRTQSRPPLPAGPRTRNRNASSASVPTREQLGVNSSAESLGRPLLPGRITRSQSISSSSGPSSGPKFQTSPTKFKGLTMEAAKWTFSSEELQSVVSKAIRQSGEASSIRLLPPRVAHTDLPDELEHTIALQNELKVQYRLQARKRDALLAALTAHAEGQEINPHTVRSKLDDLRDISANMDRITEGLYHARDQAAQLSQLLSVHSASALAMALRKLNTSFLKRSAEVQGLHQHISALEAERDEAWAQAQQVARDLDDLNDTLQTQDNNASLTRSASSRSSRVVASRKSSIRASKAGLRRGSRSQRVSSTASQLGSGRLSYMSSGTPSLSPGVIPPVPPIPRRVSSLGRIITTDLSSARYSAYTSTLSSSSETRALALAEAQAELYGILGIEDPELKPPTSLRRSITISGSSSTTPSSAVQLTRRMSDIGDTRLTRSGGIFERLQALEHVESGPDAVLAVLKLMDP